MLAWSSKRTMSSEIRAIPDASTPHTTINNLEQGKRVAEEYQSLLPGNTSPSHGSDRRSELLGLTMMAFSTLGSSLNSFFVHVATSVHGLPFATAFLIRAILQTCFAFLLLSVLRPYRPFSLTYQQWGFLSLRGIFGGIAMYLLFRSLKLLSVAVAQTIFFFNPILTMFFSAMFLSEPIFLFDGIASIISFTGIILVFYPFPTRGEEIISSATHYSGAVSALLAAIFGSMAYTAVRRLGNSVHFLLNVSSLGVASIVMGFLLGGFMTPSSLLENSKGTLYAVAGSLCAFAYQCLFTIGLQLCPAGPAMLMTYLDVPLTYTFGVILLGEKPSWFSIVGSSLVLMGSSVIGLRRAMPHRR